MNVVPFPHMPRTAELALVSLNPDEVRAVRRALQVYGAVVVECVKGAEEEQTRLDYAASADEIATLAERFERLAI